VDKNISIFKTCTVFMPTLGPSQPPFEWVPWFVSPGVESNLSHISDLVSTSKCVNPYIHTRYTPSWLRV